MISENKIKLENELKKRQMTPNEIAAFLNLPMDKAKTCLWNLQGSSNYGISKVQINPPSNKGIKHNSMYAYYIKTDDMEDFEESRHENISDLPNTIFRNDLLDWLLFKANPYLEKKINTTPELIHNVKLHGKKVWDYGIHDEVIWL